MKNDQHLSTGGDDYEFTHEITRRAFLKTTTVGLAAFAAGCTTFRPRTPSVNSTLQHACIGVGGMGAVDLDNLKSHRRLEVIALCDVDAKHLARAAALFPHARQYRDWRELLSKEGRRIDSVNIAVPDHMHAPITMTALHAGKHVYCQKPLCHDVAECRAVATAARKAGVVTQLGTQVASGLGDRMAVRWLRDGVIGKVRRIVMCSNRAGAIGDYRLVGPRPAQGSPPPGELAWDLWLGSAPERPYAPGIYHPTKWRAWQDFGTGWSGDIGCHLFSAPWKGLGLEAPLSVVAEVQSSWQDSPVRRADTWPQSQHITWNFPGNVMTGGEELTVEWFDGLMYPPKDVVDLLEKQSFPQEGMLAIGTEGALLLPHTSGPRLFPSAKFANTPRPKLAPQNHYHNFVDGCLGGPRPESDFAFAAPMTEAILLGTVAIRVPGVVLKWDPRSLSIPNRREAERYLRRNYRKGWRVRGL